tara:strand:+ start:3939 stop:4895 length:957 start_codon:yes stop_codon:yes gene_type:complete
MQKVIEKFSEKVNQHIVNKSIKRNEFSDVIWLIGDGRSGTTWVASLLNADGAYREMFEPFHPLKVPEAKSFKQNMYLHPSEENNELHCFTRKVFEGSLTNIWVDQALKNQEFSGLLVKDVFANLHAKWAVQNFPQVKPILLVRNPLSVASSKFVTRRWNWPEYVPSFNKDLSDTHLMGLDDIINEVIKRNDYIEKQVLNWCIIHKVLSEQFSQSQIHIICYEDAYLNPDICIKQTLAYADKNQDINLSNNILKASSKVSFKGSAIVEKKDPLSIWRENVTDEQILLAEKLLSSFGLSGWYPEFKTPDTTAIKNSFLKD